MAIVTSPKDRQLPDEEQSVRPVSDIVSNLGHRHEQLYCFGIQFAIATSFTKLDIHPGLYIALATHQPHFRKGVTQMNRFLNAIEAAATNEYSFAAYAIAAILFLVSGAKLRMAKLTFSKIELLPENERRRALEIATGSVLPSQVSAEEWLRHERQKWTFLLFGAVLIALLTILTIAIVNPSRQEISDLEGAVVDQAQQLRIDMWRERYEMGEVTGSASIKVDLTEKSVREGLSPWLTRVEEHYNAVLSSTNENLAAVEGISDSHIEIRPGKSTDWNNELVPEGEDEAVPHQLFFNPRFFMLTTGGNKRGLLLSTLSFQSTAIYVTVVFDRATQKATRIESFATGEGDFSPVPGQFTNWLDFYGARLIVRQRFSGDLESDLFKSLEYESIVFKAKGDSWTKSATFAARTGATLYTDDRHSLIIQKADWKTLGKLPGDYPGERLQLHGPVPDEW